MGFKDAIIFKNTFSQLAHISLNEYVQKIAI